MPRLLPHKRLRILLCTVAGVLTFFSLLSRGGGGDDDESARLVALMNEGPPATPVFSFVKSSFDWASVRVRPAPNTTTTVEPPPPLPDPAAARAASAALPRVQHRFPVAESPSAARRRQARRDEVARVFRRSWAAYRARAWGRDALLPLTGGARDQFAGWAATLVDSLDSLWILGMRPEFDEAVAHVASARLDFANASSPAVNVFETNIRYLGGLLAAYDLSRRPELLARAVELGDFLHVAFNTYHGLPADFVDLEAAKTGDLLPVEPMVVSAAPGTLSLELTRLSQLTGDPKYYDAAARVMQLFHDGQNRTRLPGLWPTFVSMSRRDVVAGTDFTLGGCADSLYEYLPKMHALLGGLDPKYAAMTAAFLRAAESHLFFRPMLPPRASGDDENYGGDILVSGSVHFDERGDTPHLDPETEHLACFVGGAFALAGRLLDLPAAVDTGARLARGCAWAYRAFPTGLMPERYVAVPCPGDGDDPCPWDEARWLAAVEEEQQKRGPRERRRKLPPKGIAAVKDPRYLLRPEAVESLFVLYRVTGREEFREAAWDIFVAVRDASETEYANAAVLDVTVAAEKPPLEDYMESFWLAETLKYFYLLFSPPDLISLDKYVFNTEAHPFLRPHAS